MEGSQNMECHPYDFHCEAQIKPYDGGFLGTQYIPKSRFEAGQFSSFFIANPAITEEFLSSLLSGISLKGISKDIKEGTSTPSGTLDGNMLINKWMGNAGVYKNMSDGEMTSILITELGKKGVKIGFLNIAGTNGGGADLIMIAKQGGLYHAVSNTGISIDGKTLEKTLDTLGYTEGRYTAFFRLIGKDGKVVGVVETARSRQIRELLFGNHEMSDFWEQVGKKTPSNISMRIQKDGYSVTLLGKNTGGIHGGGSIGEVMLPDGNTLRSHGVQIGYSHQGTSHRLDGSLGISRLETPNGQIHGLQIHGNRNMKIGTIPGCDMLHWGGGVDMELQLSSSWRIDTGNIRYTQNMICQRSNYLIGLQGEGNWSPDVLGRRYSLFQRDVSLILGLQDQENGNTSLTFGGQHHATLAHTYRTRDTSLIIQLAYKKALEGLTAGGPEGSLTYSHRF